MVNEDRVFKPEPIKKYLLYLDVTERAFGLLVEKYRSYKIGQVCR